MTTPHTDHAKPKGIQATEADVGRKVVYRTAPGYEAEEGVITSIGRIGNVFVRYGGGRAGQSTDMADLDWCFPSTRHTDPAPEDAAFLGAAGADEGGRVMTPEAKRIAIAEACGWKITPAEGVWPICYHMKAPAGASYRSLLLDDIVPDYLSDLNAMHEAEGAIPALRQGGYFLTLYGIVTGFPEERFARANEFSCFEVAHATAAQRAEAFLRTLGLWKEVTP